MFKKKKKDCLYTLVFRFDKGGISNALVLFRPAGGSADDQPIRHRCGPGLHLPGPSCGLVFHL